MTPYLGQTYINHIPISRSPVLRDSRYIFHKLFKYCISIYSLPVRSQNPKSRNQPPNRGQRLIVLSWKQGKHRYYYWQDMFTSQVARKRDDWRVPNIASFCENEKLIYWCQITQNLNLLTMMFLYWHWQSMSTQYSFVLHDASLLACLQSWTTINR